ADDGQRGRAGAGLPQERAGADRAERDDVHAPPKAMRGPRLRATKRGPTPHGRARLSLRSRSFPMATLQMGAQGADVSALQAELNQALGPAGHISVDGDFGPATRA